MKVAVVGAGVSGLAATWLLNEYAEYEVHLYEADSRVGGHANTALFTAQSGVSVAVDTAFIVFNPTTYPNFLRFLHLDPHLKARIQLTDMSFSVSRDNGLFEWGGANLGAFFCQPWRWFDPDHWRLLYDIIRFNACARRLLDDVSSSASDGSIGEYLRKNGYSESFRDDYLIPMTAAIWSTPPDKCALDFPARTLIQFMHNHHLLQIFGKPPWLTLKGGSKCYVDYIISRLPRPQLHLATCIQAVRPRGQSLVELVTESGERTLYDHVIMACHSDAALKVLRAGGGTTPDEERILGAFEWNKNVAVLHTDDRLMPKSRAAWSCWNYLTESEHEDGRRKANGNRVSVTFWMNALQHISESRYGRVFVTLNPPLDPDPARTVGKYNYDHPVLGTKAVRAQQEMHTIQRERGISFAGAWLKYGFHEDGFTSGMRAAMDLMKADVDDGTEKILPFEILDADRKSDMGMKLFAPFFDVVEGLGLRMIVGTFLHLCLATIRSVLASFKSTRIRKRREGPDGPRGRIDT